jgi:hypothetical protein
VFEPLLRFLLVFTPAGWLAKSYTDAVALHPVGWAGLLGAAFVSSLLIAPALQALRRDFRLEPIFGYATAAAPLAGPSVYLPAQNSADPPLDEVDPVDPASLPPPDVPALHLRLKELLGAEPASNLTRGWLEGRIRACLSARDKILVEALRLTPAWSWSRGWVIALGLIVCARLGLVADLAPFWPAAITTIALALFALPVFGGVWCGFNTAPSLYFEVGQHSYLPIGFWESTRVMLKVNLLRMAAGAPLLLLGLRYGYEIDYVTWPMAGGLLWRVLTVLVVLQPFWIAVNFSKTTNDSSARWWFSGLLIAAVVASLFVIVIGAVMMFSVWDEAWVLFVPVLLLLYAAGLFAGYGLAYRLGVFDLMKRPAASS